MPYYKSRRGGYRRGGYSRRNYGRRGFNRTQYRAVRKIAYKQIQQTAEKKTFDEQWDTASISLTPTFYEISNVSVGTSGSQRVGVSINAVSLLYRFQFIAGDDTNIIRMVIFQWRPDDGDHAPNWEDMFAFQTAGLPIAASDVISPLTRIQGDLGNYQIIVNKIFTLDADDPIKFFQGYIRGGFNKKIGFTTGLTTGDNHLYVLFVSDSGAVTHPTVSGFTRMTFIDT